MFTVINDETYNHHATHAMCGALGARAKLSEAAFAYYVTYIIIGTTVVRDRAAADGMRLGIALACRHDGNMRRLGLELRGEGSDDGA